MSTETYSHQQLSGENTPYDVVINDDGDIVVPDEYDQFGEEYDFAQKQETPTVPEVVIGPSTRLDERYIALAAMSKRYTEYASALSFKKTSINDEKRPGLRRKYSDLDLMANDKLARASYSPEIEKSTLMPLLKTDELIDAGFPRHEVEEIEQETVHSIRNNFGYRVGHIKRDRSMAKVNKPTVIQ